MREFLGNSKKFFEDVSTLNSYTKKYNHLSSQKNSGIYDEKNERLLTSQMEVIDQRFKELSRSLRNKLDEENKYVEENNPNMKDFNKKTIAIHLHAQTKAFAEVVNKYRDAQFRHKQEEEEKFKLQYVIAKPGADEAEIERYISEDQGDAQLASAFSLGSKSAKGILDEANKRKTNIQKIATTIQELIEMINMLNEAITKQTSEVDKITVTMATVEENTAAANVDLEQALDYQIRASRIKRIIYGILAVIVVVVVGYFVVRIGLAFGTIVNTDGLRILLHFK